MEIDYSVHFFFQSTFSSIEKCYEILTISPFFLNYLLLDSDINQFEMILLNKSLVPTIISTANALHIIHSSFEQRAIGVIAVAFECRRFMRKNRSEFSMVRA